MTKNAQITKVENQKITVRFGNSASCKNCNCLFKGFGEVKFATNHQVDVGDTAIIDIPESNISLAPFVVFGIPLLAIALGVLVGSLFYIAVQATLIVVLLVLSLGTVYLLDTKLKKRVKYTMSLVDIVPKENAPSSCALTDN